MLTALRVSAGRAPWPGPAHPAATAGFSIPQGEIPRETDCLLEGDGFELPVREHRAMAPSHGFAAASHREAALRGAPASHGETAFRAAPCGLPWRRRWRARLIAPRDSNDFAFWRRTTWMPCSMAASASLSSRSRRARLALEPIELCF